LNLNDNLSIAIAFLRAKFCKLPVTNAWGKKKPLIQKMLGVPFWIQFFKKFTRKMSSSIQAPSGFRDRNPLLAQSFPTWLSKMLLVSF
jgi:hypothetical protein